MRVLPALLIPLLAGCAASAMAGTDEIWQQYDQAQKELRLDSRLRQLEYDRQQDEITRQYDEAARQRAEDRRLQDQEERIQENERRTQQLEDRLRTKY